VSDGVGSGVIGNPAIAVDANQNTYFAAIVIGQNNTASPSVAYQYRFCNNIVIGSADINGSLLWYRFFPELVVLANQTQVSLVIGKNSDVYVAFATPAAVNNRYNMRNTPGWCPPLYPVAGGGSGTQDIVLARINCSPTSQTVAWVIQSAQLNSIWNETAPDLAIDTTTGLLYIAYQTDGDILCNTPIGIPSVALSCFTLNGKQLWLETQNNINSTGSNTNPAVTADTQGNVYIAYETTATVKGGAVITNQQIEMVKFQTQLNTNGTLQSYSRRWVLSQYSNIFTTPPATSSSPSLTCDGTNVYIAFLTTGSVGGNYPSGSYNDLVVAKITPAGTTSWIQQGNQFNRTPYIYANAVFPYIVAETVQSPLDTPNVLVSLQTFSTYPYIDDTYTNLFVFNMATATGNNIFDSVGFNNIPLAYSPAPSNQTLLPSAGIGTYSQVAIAAVYKSLYFLLGSLEPLSIYEPTSCDANLILINYNIANYYPNITPFQFMSQTKKICSCGANCSCNNNTISVPGAPSNLSSTPGNGSVSIYFTIADGNNPLINFLYSINNGATFTPFGPPQYESPVTIGGLTNGTIYSIQIKATNGIGTGPASATIMVTPGTPNAPTNLNIQPGNTTAVITFTPGSNNGSAITDYLYSLNGGGFTSSGVTGSPVTISGLTNGTFYTVQLVATNARGTGQPTANLNVRPGTPTSATNLVVDNAGDEDVTISFTPGNNNGYSVTNYAYSKNGGETFFLFSPPQTTSPVTITGLTNGTTYTFQLEGQNAYGLGPPSASVTATPGLPGVPTSLSAAGGNNSVIITFTAGINNGSAISNYLYSLDDGEFTALSPADASSPVTVGGLTTVGTVYSIQLKALNAAGTSVASATVTGSIGNPAPPTALSGAPGNGTAIISFTPGADSGYAITNYAYSTDNGSTFTDFSPAQTTSPVTISGLTNYTAYTIKLKAKNSVTYSVASAAVTVTPQLTPLVLLQASSYSGSGPWLDTSGNGRNATLLQGTIARNTAHNGVVLNGSTSWVFPNVSAGNAWTLSVWYKNTGNVTGNGACIITQQFVGNTINMAIAYRENGSSFSGGFYPPNWYYGTIFASYGVWGYYQITWDGSSMKTYINGTLFGTETILSSSLPGTGDYYIGQRWDTGSGECVVGEIGEVRIYDFTLNSTELLAQYNATKATYAAPGPPTSVSASPLQGAASVSWTAPVNTGGLPIISYIVTSNPGNFTATVSTSPATVTSLNHGTSYTFTVVATNSSASSSPSDPSNSVNPYAICLAKGTQILLADRTEKQIEDITYNDTLLVWDFDNGCLTAAPPLWIKKAEVTEQYNLLEFDNGTKLKTINQHRIFNKEAGKFTYPMTDNTPIGTTSYHVLGKDIKLANKTIVHDQTEYYNIITQKHMNLFANGILTSCRYNNIYPIANMKFMKSERPAIPSTDYQSIPPHYYEGLRLSEQPIPVEETIQYINRLEWLKQ